jgi:hypothetical protein
MAKAVGDGSTSITWTNVPTIYTDLRIMALAKDTSTTNPTVNWGLRFNTDSGSNYYYRRFWNNNGAANAAAETTTSIIGGAVTTNKSTITDFASPIDIYIPNYRSSNAKIAIISSSGHSLDATSVNTNSHSGGRWSGTSAITSITLFTSGSGWDTKSDFFLYGIKSS